jgi:tetratricopeptide (TPR) repeat protein
VTDLDALLKAAWNEHGDAPQTVADRLVAHCNRVETSAQVAPFVRLLVHVYGEHLGQWQEGVELLTTLRQQLAFAPDAAATAALEKAVATLRFAGGDANALEGLEGPLRASALATAASAFAGRNEMARAIAAFTEALRIAELGLPAGSPTLRDIAVTANNLAATWEEKTDRQPSETTAMLLAAHAALKYWKLAGTWLEEERAEYRLARSLLQAGQADAAMEPAQRCVDVCQRNGAPAFELFFGYAVLGIAQRAAGQIDAFAHSRSAALAQWQQVPEADREWCQNDLDELVSPSPA